MVEATIENTVGAAFLGCVAASMYVLYSAFLFGMVSHSRSRLFGVTLLQVYLYYIHYSKDWVFQKIAVSLLLLSLLLVLTRNASGWSPYVRPNGVGPSTAPNPSFPVSLTAYTSL